MRIGYYPGTFDPITYGHLDIITRGAKLFDKLYVSISFNPIKNPLFTKEERFELVKEVLKDIPNIEVIFFEGLLAELADKYSARYIVRGLRALSDFEYEFEIALTNRNISEKKIDTVFFMTDEQYFYLSSSLVKEVCSLGGNIEKMVPLPVRRRLIEKLHQ